MQVERIHTGALRTAVEKSAGKEAFSTKEAAVDPDKRRGNQQQTQQGATPEDQPEEEKVESALKTVIEKSLGARLDIIA